MSPPVYPNPLGPLDILTANYVNSIVADLEAARLGQYTIPPTVVDTVSLGPGGYYRITVATGIQVYLLSGLVTLAAASYDNPGTNFSADGVKFVYIYDDGGGVGALEASDDPPSDGVWKLNAFGTHRYLLTIHCQDYSTVDEILPARKKHGVVLYARESPAFLAGATTRISTGTGHRSITLPAGALPRSWQGPVILYGQASPNTVTVGGSIGLAETAADDLTIFAVTGFEAGDVSSRGFGESARRVNLVYVRDYTTATATTVGVTIVGYYESW